MKLFKKKNKYHKDLAEIKLGIKHLIEGQVILMGLVEDIKAAQQVTKDSLSVIGVSLQGIVGDVADTKAEIQALKDQITAGSPATAEDLQSILDAQTEIAASVQGVADSVKAVDDSVPGVV